MKIEVKILKLEHYDSALALPSYQTEFAAGADIYAMLTNYSDKKLIIKPFERVLVPTGLIFEIPQGFEVQIRPRSGMSFKTPIMIANSPGTIDSDYRGEIKIIMVNLSDKDFIINHGERVAQMVIAPIYQAEFIETDFVNDTQRGAKGFGSTGTN